ncbi:cephalosporin deacetylase [Paenibacillus psychroresistens]|uniref:Cephalosporin deacetylase n=1 Tax=Paenibacillus psychroresistens TaxID=1778678 RepID=A0A6B8RCW2_9BACL|nr:acetylxylan esterase [Paenibacillus psychroresistens]QGQ94301.1 cephalosporin deacetylase [Paenibacillus psychroresistens]
MPQNDLPYDQLIDYKPELTKEPDFQLFWDKLKLESSQKPLQAKLTEMQYPYKDIKIYRIQYAGLDNTPIQGWYLVPKRASSVEPLPVMVRYHGYTGVDRGYPHQFMYWCALGIAVLSIDIRGQAGETPDYVVYADGNVPGWMTKGILNPQTYYYKQVFIDCLRAIDFVAERPEIDASRIAVYGESQGGGLALAAAALDARPKIVLSIFPFLSHFKRSMELQIESPYKEIFQWFMHFDPARSKEAQIHRTLSYFDAMNMASLVTARTFLGITLQDTCCAPSASFAAYNHICGEKQLEVYPDYGHVGGIPRFQESMMQFIDTYL